MGLVCHSAAKQTRADALSAEKEIRTNRSLLLLRHVCRCTWRGALFGRLTVFAISRPGMAEPEFRSSLPTRVENHRSVAGSRPFGAHAACQSGVVQQR